jgi:molybdopterin-containing oxidoreductase family iron-sulfur binding subunit
MARRHAPEGFNRLYVLESTPTGTGAAADHRFPLRARDIADFAAALAAHLGPAEGDGDAASNEVRAIARDLRRRAGACVLLAGPSQPPEVHALVHVLNVRLGNRGRTVNYIEAPERPLERGPDALRRLVEEMRAGRVEALVLLGGNPVYNAPADLDFAEALGRVPFSVRLGAYEDETSAHCLWHLPEAHPLETWGDARAFDGTATIQQPLIAPLYGGRSALEVVAALRGRPAPSGYDRVRAAWRARWGPDAFEERWRAALEKGVVPGTAAEPRDVRPVESFRDGRREADAPGLEVVFRPDPSVWDGRFAANAWLQELPRPISKLTWENPAVVGPATARRFGLSSGDVVELRRGGAAAFPEPRMRDLSHRRAGGAGAAPRGPFREPGASAGRRHGEGGCGLSARIDPGPGRPGRGRVRADHAVVPGARERGGGHTADRIHPILGRGSGGAGRRLRVRAWTRIRRRTT